MPLTDEPLRAACSVNAAQDEKMKELLETLGEQVEEQAVDDDDEVIIAGGGQTLNTVCPMSQKHVSSAGGWLGGCSGGSTCCWRLLGAAGDAGTADLCVAADCMCAAAAAADRDLCCQASDAAGPYRATDLHQHMLDDSAITAGSCLFFTYITPCTP